MSPGPTARPRPRSARPNPTRTGTIPFIGTPRSPVCCESGRIWPGFATNRRSRVGWGVCGSRRGDLVEVLAGELEVLPLLEHGTEREVGGVGRQVLLTEQVERARPVDRLRDAGRLGQLQLAQAVDRGDHAAGQLARHTGLPERDDLDLALGVGVVDPVVEAPALEGVVQLAGAVDRKS